MVDGGRAERTEGDIRDMGHRPPPGWVPRPLSLNEALAAIHDYQNLTAVLVDALAAFHPGYRRWCDSIPNGMDEVMDSLGAVRTPDEDRAQHIADWLATEKPDFEQLLHLHEGCDEAIGNFLATDWQGDDQGGLSWFYQRERFAIYLAARSRPMDRPRCPVHDN